MAAAAGLSPAIIAALISGGSSLVSGLGSAIGGSAQNNETKGQIKQSEMMQDMTTANSLARQQELSPLRDQAIYGAQSMAGLTPGTFSPLNYGSSANATIPGGTPGPGGGTGSQGGIPLAQLQAMMAKYQPGAGGSGPMNAVNQAALTRLGYGTTGQLTGQANQGNAAYGLPTAPGSFGAGSNNTAPGAPNNPLYAGLPGVPTAPATGPQIPKPKLPTGTNPFAPGGQSQYNVGVG